MREGRREEGGGKEGSRGSMNVKTCMYVRILT